MEPAVTLADGLLLLGAGSQVGRRHSGRFSLCFWNAGASSFRPLPVLVALFSSALLTDGCTLVNENTPFSLLFNNNNCSLQQQSVVFQMQKPDYKGGWNCV